MGTSELIILIGALAGGYVTGLTGFGVLAPGSATNYCGSNSGLWDKYYTAALRQRAQSERQYSINPKTVAKWRSREGGLNVTVSLKLLYQRVQLFKRPVAHAHLFEVFNAAVHIFGIGA